MMVTERHFTALRSIALASLAILIAANSFVSAQTQPSPPKNPSSVGDFQLNNAGALAKNQDILPGVPFPPAMSQSAVQAFFELRDSVYSGVAPESVDAQATSLLKSIGGQQLSENDRALLEARIAYLAGRSWNDHKNKKKAAPWFERAVDAAHTMIALDGETPTALVALAEPLGELSLLKDLGFLVSNGPKVGQYANKALESEPRNIKAWLLKASALAYPPPIWGGNYKKALETYAAILPMAETGLPKDVLFDIRVGIATAYANLKLSEHAAWWFKAALELYPQNPYAKSELEKLAP
jgi:tetratricopeptide (TPR) repeat protein